jgi:hypothetical protein
VDKIIIKREALEQYIKETITDGNWPMPSEPHPSVVNEPPLRDDYAVITPAAQTQVSEPNMPVEDEEWAPGNNNELRKASSQLVEQVPEGQREWFWGRLKNLVMKTQEDGGTPGTGDMEYEREANETLPTDKQTQRSSEPWRERQGLSPNKR